MGPCYTCLIVRPPRGTLLIQDHQLLPPNCHFRLAVLGSVFKCCRPLGQQMKAYHSVMPAAVTRRPLADMRPKPMPKNDHTEVVLAALASHASKLSWLFINDLQ